MVAETQKETFLPSRFNWPPLYRFQNHSKLGNLGKIARFAIRAKPGIVLIEFVLSEDPLYLPKVIEGVLMASYLIKQSELMPKG